VYGTNGLIHFVDRLFGTVSPHDREQFNYFFSLKHNFHLLETQSYTHDIPAEQHVTLIKKQTPKSIFDSQNVVAACRITHFGAKQLDKQLWVWLQDWHARPEQLRVTH
jgi:hypothetical protein